MTVQQLRMVLGSYPYPELDDDGREIRRPQPGDAAESSDVSAHDEPRPDPDETPSAGSTESTDNNQSIGPEEWCSFTVGDNRMLRLSAGLHPETGDVVRRALDSARSRLFNGGQTDVNTIDALRTHPIQHVTVYRRH